MDIFDSVLVYLEKKNMSTKGLHQRSGNSDTLSNQNFEQYQLEKDGKFSIQE